MAAIPALWTEQTETDMGQPMKKTTWGQVFGDASAATTEFSCAGDSKIKSIITTGGKTAVTSLQFTCTDGTKSPVWGTPSGTPVEYDYSRANYNIQGMYGTIGSSGLTEFGFLNNEQNPQSGQNPVIYPAFGKPSWPNNPPMNYACPIAGQGVESDLTGLKVGAGLKSIAAGCAIVACPPGSTYNTTSGTCKAVKVPEMYCPSGYMLSRGACQPESNYTPDQLAAIAKAEADRMAYQNQVYTQWATEHGQQQQSAIAALLSGAPAPVAPPTSWQPTPNPTSGVVAGSLEPVGGSAQPGASSAIGAPMPSGPVPVGAPVADPSYGYAPGSVGVPAASEGTSWFFWVMIFVVLVALLAAIGGGIWWWRKRAAQQKAVPQPEKA